MRKALLLAIALLLMFPASSFAPGKTIEDLTVDTSPATTDIVETVKSPDTVSHASRRVDFAHILALGISNEAYSASWDTVTTVAPSKNAVYDYVSTIGSLYVSNTAYGAGWDGVLTIAPSKNAVYDYVNTIGTLYVSDTAYGAGWDSVTTIAPSKNAVYDYVSTIGSLYVSDTAYAASWDSVTTIAPSKNAVYDYLNTFGAAYVSDTAYAGSWDGVTTIAPSKNAVYDYIELLSLTGALGNMLKSTYDQNDDGKIDSGAVADLSATYMTPARIGVTVQAYDADLDYLATFTPTANVKTLLNSADNSAMRTNLGLAIGTNVQAYDADLTTWAGVTPHANGASLVATDYAGMRTLLGVQPSDADLATLASPTAWNMYYSDGSSVQTGIGFGTAGYVLTSAGAAAAPSFAAMDADLTTLAAPAIWKLYYSNGTSVQTGISFNTDGYVLRSNGATSAPSFSALTDALVPDILTLGTGSAIDATPIGAGTASTGAFTTLSAGAAGMTVDADGDTVAKSFAVPKVGTTAGQACLYDGAAGTDQVCLEGPPDRNPDANLILQFPSENPTADQFLLYPAPTVTRSTAAWKTFPIQTAGNNPTTDLAGEIAIDVNNQAIEIYAATASRIIPTVQTKEITILEPDLVQAKSPDLIMFHVDADAYPFGITIVNCQITLMADAAYAMVFEEWAGDPPAAQADIETITTGAGDSYMEDTSITNPLVDADDYVVLDLPTTDVPIVTAQVNFYVNEGN